MVNNSTNINKPNNHLSPKESLNSDGQQFHQYQQTKQSPLVLNKKQPQHIMLKSQVLAWGQTQKCGGVKPVNGI
jgi:hypothetical protein